MTWVWWRGREQPLTPTLSPLPRGEGVLGIATTTPSPPERGERVG
jgi:hypothetical protein